MRYIYPECNNKYNKYIESTNQKCKIKYGISLNELKNKQNKSNDEEQFIDYFNNHYTLGMGDCTINKICRNIENKFDKSN